MRIDYYYDNFKGFVESVRDKTETLSCISTDEYDDPEYNLILENNRKEAEKFLKMLDKFQRKMYNKDTVKN